MLRLFVQGSTMMYSKSGHRINNFPSLLPAGCRSKRRHSTAADGGFAITYTVNPNISAELIL